MDPWLEHPGLWPDVHNRLIAAISDAIADQLPDRYYVGLEERTVVSAPWEELAVGLPDLTVGTSAPVGPGPGGEEIEPGGGVAVLDVVVAIEEPIRETYLEIHDARDGRIVTVIELLSPSNKVHQTTRAEYVAKRSGILQSRTALVEIDLLRAGRPMPLATTPPGAPIGPYRILVCRGRARPRGKLYVFGLRAAIPDVPIPLLPEDPEPTVPLNALLHRLAERARYHLRVDYGKPPVPPLGPLDAEWARGIVARPG